MNKTLTLVLAWACVASASGCRGCVSPRPVAGRAAEPDVEEGTPSGGRAALARADEDTRRDLSRVLAAPWTIDPPELQVFRDTRVRLAVTTHDTTHSCQWDLGEGARTEGCDVTHTFRGGLADAWVGLTVTDEGGDEVLRQRRRIPLERLPVVPLRDPEADGARALPGRPEGARSHRILFVGPVEGADRLERLVDAITERLRPDLVIHTGDLIPSFSERAFADWMRRFLTPLATASVPLVVLPGEVERSSPLAWKVVESTLTQILFRPVLDWIDDAAYPLRFSFRLGSHAFVFVDSESGDISDEGFRWLKGQLAQAAAYARVFVVTHLPLAPYTADSSAYLKRAFKLQELMHRYRGALLVTGHDPVFFDGRFAGVRVLSSGGAVDDAPSLIGEDVAQGGSALLIDLIFDKPPRALGVTGDDWDRWLPTDTLPRQVDRYVRHDGKAMDVDSKSR